MSVGIGIVGREITFTLGGSATVGQNSKGFTFNNEALDSTDDNSSGWQERLATAGLKSIEFTMSGLLKNLELMAAYAGTSQIFPVVATYPDGSTWTGDFFLDSVSATGESNGLTTFDASFSSSGSVAFVAGT
jgi:predicted secreted protein